MQLEALCIRSIRLGSLVAILLFLTIIGCGGRRTGNVSGKVSYKGKPLPGGNVVFMSEAEGATLKSCAINADGTYTVAKVPVGPASVTVLGSRLPLRPGQKKTKAEVQQEKAKEVYVPPKYANAQSSGLKCEVQPGPQQYDIDLK